MTELQRAGSVERLKIVTPVVRWSMSIGCHTKLGVNMVNCGEPSSTRLHKEERIGSGWKHSRQKFPRQTVFGWHLQVEGVRYAD